MWIVMIKSLRYYKIVMHKKVSHPDEIQNTNHIYLHSKLRTNQRPIDTCTAEPILIVYMVRY